MQAAGRARSEYDAYDAAAEAEAAAARARGRQAIHLQESSDANLVSFYGMCV